MSLYVQERRQGYPNHQHRTYSLASQQRRLIMKEGKLIQSALMASHRNSCDEGDDQPCDREIQPMLLRGVY